MDEARKKRITNRNCFSPGPQLGRGIGKDRCLKTKHLGPWCVIILGMRAGEHLRLTGGALKQWFIAQSYDALAVAGLWLIGLLLLRVPLAILWAALGAVLQFVPNVGPALTLIGPAVVLGVQGLFGGDWMRLLYLLILYAAIAAIDGFLLQPAIMKRTARVPVSASIITPIVFGLLLGFWGVLLSAPLLAVVFAYRRRAQANQGLDRHLP
jgi:predicted PurR-regulated permease PerM